MVFDAYDEDRRLNAQKMDDQFYASLDNEEKEQSQNTINESDKLLLEMLNSLSPEQKEMLLKQALQSKL